ncbi:thiol reductant ABC exporter subunit CydD [Glaciihabitans sp. dw_435]|uniref:thiol reductant ABC exporter subunit CydD n=1 Tax=Glaciihabitans sp. dw_435 TaxID=2720081 RepID=UPI002107D265|nr:thiol reductant ABC exporter subunit CydD [Glaciihabitans sp. dw_435]
MTSPRERMQSALLSAGLGNGGMRTMYVLGLFSALKAGSLVLLADALARGITGVIAADHSWQPALVTGLIAAVLRAVAHWATQAYAARQALGVKEQTRQDLADHLVEGGNGSVGAMTSLATRGLDELDKYYTVVLPAITGAAVIPLLIGVRILFADWVSALVIVVTIPLIPVFMALIGMHTRERVSDASAALGRLSDHLVELARGLPVLVGLGRVEEQTAALKKISDNYRTRTMATLRTAFMSSLALELISTISVALVAVFIGVRLVSGSLPLEIGLLVLILAPECFAPFRDMGAAFHAAQDGVVALKKAQTVLAEPVPEPLTSSSTSLAAPGTLADVHVRDLTVAYAGRTESAIDGVSFDVLAGTITALRGPSGSGKSTILAVLAGRLRNGTDDAVVTGSVTGIDPARVAWVPQHPHTVGDTVREELRLYAGEASIWQVDSRIDELLRLLALAPVAEQDPAQLSPGELRRVAVARALLRVDAGATLVLMDEPTAHVDGDSSRVIETAIAGLRGRVTVVLASHEFEVSDLATESVFLGEPSARARALTASPLRAMTSSMASATAAPASAHNAGPGASTDPSLTDPSLTDPAGERRVSAVRLLLEIIRPASGKFVLAIFLGVLAALFAVALTAVSGWLIVRASGHPSMMYLMVAIVGVRFFGVGRSALRYAERLVTHDAIFASVTVLRMRLWGALAAKGTTSRKLLRGGTALDYLVVTADQVRDLSPRVILPPIIGVLTGVAAIIATQMLHAPAVALLVAYLLVCLVVAPAIALWGDRRASRGQLLIRSEVTRRFASLLAAAGDLRANAVDGAVRERVRDLDAAAGKDAKRSAWALGLGGAVIVAASCAASVLMLIVSAPAVAAGTLPGETVAVLVLLPLGLMEPLLSVVDAVQQWPALAQAVRRLAPFRAAPVVADAGIDLPGSVTGIELRDISARWPDAPETVFSGLSAVATPGDWLVVTGPSGSGKSTLLTVLLGHLTPSRGAYLVDGADSGDLNPASLRRHIAWAPQEGHLFDSTLRANLLLARAHDDAPDDEEMFDALDRVGLADFVRTLPRGLDTRVGSEGDELSGGQRQRVAVARTLLTRAEVVLLDEPTAHLDVDAAHDMMRDLRDGLASQITVLVTHHADDLRATDTVLTLAGHADGGTGTDARADTATGSGTDTSAGTGPQSSPTASLEGARSR